MNTKANHAPSARNYGIDALRLLAIFMVVMLHVIGFGGVSRSATGAGRSIVSWLWVICYCSVDCFAIISGYVGYSEKEKPYRYSRYVPLWLQVFFYSFGLALLFFLLKPGSVDAKTLIKHALPVFTGHYWYFTSYTVLFFLVPWLNRFVRRCSRRAMHLCALGLFLIFPCGGSLLAHFGLDMGLKEGYSFLWLTVLYLTGAWMKKCDVPALVKSRYALLLAAACTAVTWVGRGMLDISPLLSYISPTITLLAMALLIIFARLQPGARASRWIACFAPAAFGVYLIHLQLTVWEYCILDRFTWIGKSPAWLLVVQLLACCIAIFIGCLLLEKGRILLFNRLKINQRAQALCEKIGGAILAKLRRAR